ARRRRGLPGQPGREAPGRGRPQAAARVEELPVSWRERAECLGRDMFPDPGDGEAVAACMELCARCPVAAECEAWREEEHPEFGVWAGRLMDLYPPPGARICDWCTAAGEDPPTEAMARGLCNRHYQ